MKVWIVYKVLSHEMGEIDSEVYGVYADKEKAELAAIECEQKHQDAWDCHGYYQEFEVKQ